MARKLGKNQKRWLSVLMQRYNSQWYPQCGVVFGSYSETVRLCDSWVRRGVMTKNEKGIYTLAVPKHEAMKLCEED